MHPNIGKLRAYLDGQLAPDELEKLNRHMKSCQQCQEKVKEIKNRMNFSLAQWDGLNTREQIPSTANYKKILLEQVRMSRKENTNMSRTLKWQSLWVTIGIIIAFAIALSFPQVRAAANNFLGLFRVEKVQVVQVDYSDFSEEPFSETTLSNLDQFFAENVNLEGGGESEVVSNLEEAEKLAGFTVRFPTALDQPAEIMVQPGGVMSFQIDLELVQAVLEELGQTDIELAKSLDGASVKITIPDAVISNFGDCQSSTSEFEPPGEDSTPQTILEESCTSLLQVPSPTIDAPPELDINQLGVAYLRVLGMPQREAEQYARSVDWTSTFIIPVPRYGTQYLDLSVDGVSGIYIKYQGERKYVLIWVRDGIIYALNGYGGSELAQDIANTMP